VLDNQPVFGARRSKNSNAVDGVMLTRTPGVQRRRGAAPDNTYAHVVGLWDEIGLPRSYDYVEPTGTAASLKFARDHIRPDVLGRGSGLAGLLLQRPFSARKAWVSDPWSDDLRARRVT